MNITERAKKVLTEIDAALALAEKEPAWTWDDQRGIVVDGHQQNQLLENGNKAQRRRTGKFIGAARQGWPACLRCLKKAIEGLQYIATNTPPCLSSTAWAIESLTTICDQWEAGRMTAARNFDRATKPEKGNER